MKGFEVIFMAPRSRRHDGTPVLDAIVDIAREHDITRMTRRVNAEGTGAGGHCHSAHFFELADEPEELMFVLDGGDADALIRAVEAKEMHVFCLRRQIDYWQFGDD
ncbi:DUF190 domain-containing protein [Salinisphaera aquimarina]|uniref:DUF190 domain-containing protein n=1 Tax=Salinisphaera aquimarina TaxID=2094031 RepID=A0ABV7ENC9_9GAMM